MDEHIVTRPTVGAKGTAPSPSQLRAMFGANLRQLAERAPSIAALSRDLGINRTQLNRYLSGESFPRPDILYQICRHFGVDARVLLEPLDRLNTRASLFQNPMVSDFLGAMEKPVSEGQMPRGMYRFVRASFLEPDRFVTGLVLIFDHDGQRFIRGYESRDVMRRLALPETLDSREYRGVFLPQMDGVMFLVSRRNGASASFGYLSRHLASEACIWTGFSTLAIRDSSRAKRVVRILFEFLGHDTGRILTAARAAGTCTRGGLSPHHRHMLGLDAPSNVFADQDSDLP